MDVSGERVGPVEKDRSNGDLAAGDGKAITLNGVTYAKGLGAHAPSDIRYALNGLCGTLTASVGVDDEVGANGGIVFQVLVDGVKKYDSGLMIGATVTAAVTVSLTGANELGLVIADGGNGNSFDHGDWANAQVVCGATGGNPTPPTITGVSPAAAASAVGVTTNVTAIFAAAMTPSTLTTGTFTLVPQGSATVLAAAVSMTQPPRP